MFSSFDRRHGRANMWGCLAVFAVLAVIFFGFVIPVINSARLVNYNNMCRRNIKELALATATYEEANKGFPALYFRNLSAPANNEPLGSEADPSISEPHYSWIIRVLPYIEEKRLYDQLELNSKKFELNPSEVRVTTPNDKEILPRDFNLAGMFCQYSSNDQNKFLGITSFVAMTATKQQLLTVGHGKTTQADGIIIPSTPQRLYKGASIATVRDGVSKTFLLAETNEDERSNWYHWQQTFVCGFFPGDTSVPDHDPQKGIPRIDLLVKENNGWVFNTKAGNRTALVFGSPSDFRRTPYNSDQTDPLRRTLGPSSEHGNNTVLHVNGDASVREIDVKTIDPQIYYRAITRAGEPWITLDDED